ncbi:spinster family MFS transporter [Sphingomonas sp. 28-63-12]|uniref:spinster family MFS transporter n=1 Tax=Sphingomonas sp. 28-63-12 TaxID=1970434 RepID=UPI0035A8835C
MTPAPATGRYKWYVLGILTLAQTCHSIDRAIIGLVLEPVGSEFGLSDTQRGIIAGFAYGIFFALAAIPFGIAVDRFNRRKLMTIALTLWSGCTALCGFATGFWSLLLGRAAVGITEAGGTPMGMSLLSDYFVKEQRATALGIWYLSSGVGLSIAFFVGGWVIADHGWRSAFFAAGIPGLLLAPILYLTLREPVRGNTDAAPTTIATTGLWRRIGELAAIPGLTHCFIAIVLIATGIYGMSTWITSFLIRTHGVPIKQAGLLVAITYGVLGSVGGFAAGWGVDWLNARRGGFDAARTAAFGSVIPLLTAASGMAAMIAPSLNLCLIFLFACGFFSASYNGPIYAVIVTLAGPDLRGLAVSIVQMGANLIGVGAGAFLIGAISQYVGGTHGVAWGIGIALLFTLWGGLHLWLASRTIRRAASPAAAALHTPAAMA